MRINWGLSVSFKLKFTPVGGDVLDAPCNRTREIISFEETEHSFMMSSRALAWRSHIIDIRTMRLPRRVALAMAGWEDVKLGFIGVFKLKFTPVGVGALDDPRPKGFCRLSLCDKVFYTFGYEGRRGRRPLPRFN